MKKNLRLLGFLLLLLSACSCDPETLTSVPPCQLGELQSCYDGPAYHEGNGICTLGKQTCLGKAGWGECIGWIASEPEICADNLDNNCNRIINDGCPEICDGKDNNGNNLIDENFSGKVCGKSLGICTKGFEVCIRGEIICQGGIQPKRYPGCTGSIEDCGMELCNQLDDDCDGSTDENIAIQSCWSGPESAVTYRGPAGISLYGECRPGIEWCTPTGMTDCLNQTLPDYIVSECSTNRDNDCDGITDFPNAIDIDITFAVDDSGSMHFRKTYIQNAIYTFHLRTAPFPQVQTAGIRVDGNATDDNILAWQLQSATDAISNGVSFGTGPNNGAEDTLGAMVGMAQPTSPFYPTWRPGIKHVAILFTDEICGHPWCGPIRGCPSGHWCETIMSEGEQLLPSDVPGFTPNDIEHIVFIPANRNPTEPPPLTRYYSQTNARIESMSSTSNELTDDLIKILLEITCREH